MALQYAPVVNIYQSRSVCIDLDPVTTIIGQLPGTSTRLLILEKEKRVNAPDVSRVIGTSSRFTRLLGTGSSVK